MAEIAELRRIANERGMNEWVEAAAVGNRCCYHIGDVSDGHRVKSTAARHAMAGKLFLYQLKGPGDLYRYCAIRLSASAGAVFRMGEMQ